MNFNSIDDLIASRRSHFTKEFNGDEVSNEVVERMMKNAGWAPSHKLTLPWRFRVFGKEELPALIDQIMRLYLNNTPPDKQSEEKKNKILSLQSCLSHAIAIGIHYSGQVPAWEETAAVGAAVQNMYLTLVEEPHAAGYWTTGNGTGTIEMRDYCGWSDPVVHAGFFFLGSVNEKRYAAKR